MPDVLDIELDNEMSTHDSMQCCSIEEMQEASTAAGWSIHYRQLQPGQLMARAITGQCGPISLLDQSASRQLEVVGQSPEGCVTVMVPVGRSSMWANGHCIDNRAAFLLNSSSNMHLVTEPRARVLSMHVPTSILDESARNLFESCEGFHRESQKINGANNKTVQRIMMLMHAAIYRPADDNWQLEQASLLVADLAASINRHAETTERYSRPSTAESWRTIQRSREFIEAHLAEPIKIGEVCAYSAASLSKLERTFQRELNMSPREYILARRLVAVHGELKKASSRSTQIARIAMDCGFSHLGRFSGAYRRHFGELPSATVRSC